MHKIQVHLLIVIFSICMISIFSCGDDRPIKLTRADTKVIDSIFFEQKDSLMKLTDSLCDQQYSALLAHAVDSIKTLRREEIQFILGK